MKNKNLYMQEEICEIKDDHRILIYDSEVFESRFTSVQEVFKYAQNERGRCTGKVYIGDKNPKHIGWIFEKRVKYTDCNDTYLQETWLTLHSAPAKKVIKYSPMYLD